MLVRVVSQQPTSVALKGGPIPIIVKMNTAMRTLHVVLQLLGRVIGLYVFDGQIWDINQCVKANFWRKGWDSNPRCPCRHAGFQDRCLKPLGHPSVFTTQALSNAAFGREVPMANCSRN